MKKLFLVGFQLSGDLMDEVNKMKQEVISECGMQSLVDDVPHCTLNLNQFDKIEKVDEEIKKAVESFPVFEIFVDGLGSFDNEVIFLKVLPSDLLTKLQEKIAKSVASFHIGEHCRETQPRLNLTSGQISNSEKFGFPYVGKTWVPHITIAVLKKECFTKLGKKLLKRVIKRNFLLDKIILYEWSDGWKLFRVYELKR